ncbi:MAG TPA: hypothetical protein VMU63_02420 [Acidimicrobiales bacterium]|nr:hypothetical protein [Acidimicrobiales bacterium]
MSALVRTRVVKTLAVAGAAGMAMSGCGLAARQARADVISSALSRTLQNGEVTGMLYTAVVPLPPRRPAPPGPGRIAAAGAGPLPFVIDMSSGRSAVSAPAGGPPQLIFTSNWMYERRPANPSAAAAALLASTGAAPSNVPLLKEVSVTPVGSSSIPGRGSTAGGGAATPPASAVPTGYQAVSVQSRPWLALDYGALSSRSRTGEAGSLAISPALLLRLAGGLLTGSVEPLSSDRSADASDRSLRALVPPGTTAYRANFGLDKADKGLTDAQKQVVAKIMTANAVPGSTPVFPGAVWLGPDGTLGGLSVVITQRLDPDTQALLIVSLVIGSSAGSAPAAPGAQQVVSVSSLGDLIHEVAP